MGNAVEKSFLEDCAVGDWKVGEMISSKATTGWRVEVLDEPGLERIQDSKFLQLDSTGPSWRKVFDPAVASGEGGKWKVTEKVEDFLEGQLRDSMEATTSLRCLEMVAFVLGNVEARINEEIAFGTQPVELANKDGDRDSSGALVEALAKLDKTELGETAMLVNAMRGAVLVYRFQKDMSSMQFEYLRSLASVKMAQVFLPYVAETTGKAASIRVQTDDINATKASIKNESSMKKVFQVYSHTIGIGIQEQIEATKQRVKDKSKLRAAEARVQETPDEDLAMLYEVVDKLMEKQVILLLSQFSKQVESGMLELDAILDDPEIVQQILAQKAAPLSAEALTSNAADGSEDGAEDAQAAALEAEKDAAKQARMRPYLSTLSERELQIHHIVYRKVLDMIQRSVTELQQHASNWSAKVALTFHRVVNESLVTDL